MKLKIIQAAVISSILFSCGSEKISKTITLDGENNDINGDKLVLDTIVKTNRFSRVDSVGKYGFGWRGNLAPEFQNKAVKVVVKGKYRATENDLGVIVLALDSDAGSKFWHGLQVKNYNFKLNEWVTFSDSLTLDSKVTNELPLKFSTYSFMPSGGGFLDVDDLEVKLEVAE